MDVQGKRVLVVGLAKSGVAAALFLSERGARVTISDAKTEPELAREIPSLLDRGISVETGGHGELTFQDQDLIVISPGVPVDAPLLQQARARGIKVIGEVELASQFLQGPIIAITGSNGKTTTTTLCGEMLAGSGIAVQVGGNIGTPVTAMIESSAPEKWNVLEVSSFQLETIESFRPRIAAVLNVTPDHLDRHGSFEVYAAAKARIFEFQGGDDSAVLNADDMTCVSMAAGLRSKVFWFSRQKPVQQGASLFADQIIFQQDGKRTKVMPVSEIPLKGAHNLENVLAGVCIAMLAGCSTESVRAAVRGFRAVEHRL
jgi:UDP-N-acetylmuramoylalanine--D-glutamate ligase